MIKKVFLFAILLVFLTKTVFPDERKIKLTFLGDIMAHTVNYTISDYNSIYAHIEGILKQDALTFANLEFPVDSSRPYSTYPRFNIGLEYVQAAAKAGVEVFSLANNHAYDQGREGLFQTLRSMALLEEITGRKIYYSGIRGNLMSPFKPVEIKKEGLRVGFLAVTQMTNVYQRYPYVHVVDYRHRKSSAAFLTYIREIVKDFDLFILSYHGGREYALNPDPEKVRFFHQLLEAGVHIVYAHHPHVLQPFRVVNMEGGNRLIIFSAGNFISGMTWSIDPGQPQNFLPHSGDSALWVVEIVHSGRYASQRRQVSVEKVKPILITNYKNERGEMVVDTFTSLMNRDLSEKWSSFYLSRYRVMEDLIRNWRQGSD